MALPHRSTSAQQARPVNAPLRPAPFSTLTSSEGHTMICPPKRQLLLSSASPRPAVFTLWEAIYPGGHSAV